MVMSAHRIIKGESQPSNPHVHSSGRFLCAWIDHHVHYVVVMNEMIHHGIGDQVNRYCSKPVSIVFIIFDPLQHVNRCNERTIRLVAVFRQLHER